MEEVETYYPLTVTLPAVTYPHTTAWPVKFSTVQDPETGIGNGEVPDPFLPTSIVQVLVMPTSLKLVAYSNNKLAEHVTVMGPVPVL